MLREAVFVRRRRIEVVPRDVWSRPLAEIFAGGFFVPFFKKLSAKNAPSDFTFLLSCATLYTSEFLSGNNLKRSV